MPDRGKRARRTGRDWQESPLSATWRPAIREKAVLVGLGRRSEEAGLDELAALAETAGAAPVARVVQTRSDPDPATFVGKGKIGELHDAIHSSGADARSEEHTSELQS